MLGTVDLNIGGGTPAEADALIDGTLGQPPMPISWSPAPHSLTVQSEKLQAQMIADHELDLTRKRRLGKFARRAIVAQLIVTNIGFVVYFASMTWGMHMEIPAQVMSAWLTTTVVEIVAIALTVKYLFPESGHDRNSKNH